MTPEKISRINELAHKSKTTGLTDAEKAEQQALRTILRSRSRTAQSISWRRKTERAIQPKRKSRTKTAFPLFLSFKPCYTILELLWVPDRRQTA